MNYLAKIPKPVQLAGVLLIAGTLYPMPSLAETVVIPAGHQRPELSHMERPVKGMSASDVIAQFGEPRTRSPKVGDPPISKWEFDNYSVYFEYDIVLHSVFKHRQRLPPIITTEESAP